MAQLTRENWLQHGLEKLAADGVEALRIAALCDELGVTKGSFYHHFKNQRAYLEAILHHWETQYTAQFIDSSEAGHSAAEKLMLLNERVLESFGLFEVHIRTWAQSDPLAREVQARVDQQRLAYLHQLYHELLGDAERAQAMAHLVYTTLIGSTHIVPALERHEFEQMMAQVAHLVQNSLEGDTK